MRSSTKWSLLLLLSLMLMLLEQIPFGWALKEVQVDSDGEYLANGDTSVNQEDSLSVSIANYLEERISIYWYDQNKDDDEGFLMMDLSPKQQVILA
jgi:hypothetical protein